MEQEYDLVRYDRLRLVCQKALEQVIKRSLSVEQVFQCFPELALSLEGRKALTTAQQQLVTYWHRTGLREFDLIFSEFEVEPKLRALDRVIARAQQRKADPSLIPALADLKQVLKNCMLFAGVVQYKMPRETYGTLISLESLLM